MNLGLIGRGRMGREVERVAREAGHEVRFAVGRSETVDLPAARVDAVIEFTRADAVVSSVDLAARARVPIVVGTTGWENQLEDVRAIVREHGIGLVYGANFSVGANAFFKLVEEAARLFNRFPDYDPYVIEHHHSGKLDSPSGTALRLARSLVARLDRKTRILTEKPAGAVDPEALHVASVRAGAAYGQHVVGFDSRYDSIELQHTAHGREGFARGALLAAEWIQGRQGAFEFAEILEGPDG